MLRLKPPHLDTTSESQRGFTIVELLIVIVVIGILAAITIVSFNGVQQKARDTKRQNDMAVISKALTIWAIQNNKDFAQTNAGSLGETRGWFDQPYGSYESIQSVLTNAGLLTDGVHDPINSIGTPTFSYLLSPCVNGVNTSRVILMHFEKAPTKTLSEQLAPYGCNSAYITNYAASYGVNTATYVEI